MSASITIANLSWSTPDGRPLFSNLDLSFDAGRIGLVGRNGVGKSTLLRLVSGELYPPAGAITVKGTLGVLRQSVQVGPTETIADLFGVAGDLALLRRAEAGEASAEQIGLVDWTLAARMASRLGQLGLTLLPETLLATLSGGQRTRAALAALVFQEPDFVVLDEPTNNLDRDRRNAVIDLLAGWRAGAIVVSHDRELLETMDAIVELTSLGATRYGGNWGHYRQRRQVELEAARHDLAIAEKQVAEIDRRAQATAERKARKDGAGKRRRERGDIPRIRLNALRNRSEVSGGTAVRLAERRRSQARTLANAAREKIEVLQALSVVVPSTGLPAGKTLLRVKQASFAHDLGRPPVIADQSFDIVGSERVAVVGPNGSGKTTLLKLVEGRLVPQRGSVEVTTDLAVLDQQIGLLDPSQSIDENFRRLNPQSGENACRAALARFMFRAEAALQVVSTLSGGQLLRAGLACVLGARPPSLLILDEPTNHLDVDSIEAVEAGLRAYDGALLVVSHDEVFLESIGVTRRLELPG